MHTETVLSALLLALCLPFLLGFSRAIASPLSNVPGPLLARFTRFWYFYAVYTGQAHHINIQLHRKYAKGPAFYAPIVRLGPNLYSIGQADKAIYGIASRMPKSAWYDGWRHPSPARWTVFTDRNIQRHAETRRKFQTLFSLSNLLHFEPFVDEAQTLFRQRLEELAQSGKTTDMHRWLRSYAFDVVGLITFGSRFGFLDNGEDIEDCMRSLDALGIYATLAGIYPWLHPITYRILERFPGSGARGRSYIMSIVRRRIMERIDSRREEISHSQKPVDPRPVARSFVDSALDDAENKKKSMTLDNVLMMAVSNVVAGSDTTAISLTSILWHLMQAPDVLERLRAELNLAIERGQMTKGSMSFAKTQGLPYLQACIKEALRLCSATGLPLWRVVQKGGLDLHGQYLPEGTEVGINPWVSHYNRDIWGADAERFRPERWIEAADRDPAKLTEMESHYFPFGLGSRTCSGRHIASLEIYKLVPMLVLNFDMKLAYPQETLRTMNYWLTRPLDFKLKLTLRT